MVESRERPEGMPERPRAFLAMMISSNKRIDDSVATFVSLSWMNSLNPVMMLG